MTKISSASSLTNDPAAFAAWARTAFPKGMTPDATISYLSGEGVYIKPKGEKRSIRKGPLEVGEVVKVNGDKCTHPLNKKNCGALTHSPENPIYCVITKIHKPEDLKESCTIEVAPISLQNGKPGNKFSFIAVDPVKISGLTKKLESAQRKLKRFEDKNDQAKANIEKAKIEVLLKTIREKSLSPHDGVGLYRAFKNIGAYLSSNAPKPLYAIVYDKGGKTKAPAARKDLTSRMLMEREKKTSLHGNFSDLMEGTIGDYSILYYEGNIISAGYNSDNQFYFLIEERDGRGFTTINPSVGKLYFVSSSADMPSEKAWHEEFRARLTDIVETSVDS